MSIPDYVHPFRLILACFGLDPRRSLPGSGLILQVVSGVLEVAPTTATQLLKMARTELGPPLQAMTEGPEPVLNIAPGLARIISGLEGVTADILRATTDDPSSELGNWIERHLCVDHKIFEQLLTWALGRLPAASCRPGTRGPELDELDRLCDALITAAPAAFHGAHRVLLEQTLGPHTPSDLQRQHASLLALHHLYEADQHSQRDEPRSALLELLRAWEDAADTTIYAVIEFIASMRIYQGGSHGPAQMSMDPDRSAVVAAASQWCDANSIHFPFRRDLYELRDALARKQFTLSEEVVAFTDKGGRAIAILGAEEAAAVIQRDVLLAAHFAAALPPAEFRHLDRMGAFDGAWSTARSCIPELDLMTVDVDSIRPDLPRNDRWPYFTPRYFGELRVGGASLWVRSTTKAAKAIAPSPTTELDGPDRRALELLLHSLFASEPEQLSMFLYHQPDGVKFVNSLPSSTVSMDKWTHAAVRELIADGRLNEQFFADLAAYRPRRTQEIDAMRRRVLG